MSILNDIQAIKSKTFVFAVLNILFLFLPGVMGVFLFQREIFLDIDWFKLILLSSSIVAPFLFINYMLVIPKIPNNNATDDESFGLFTLSITLTGLIIYTGIGISYLFNRSLATTVIVVSAFEIVAVAIKAVTDIKAGKVG